MCHCNLKEPTTSARYHDNDRLQDGSSQERIKGRRYSIPGKKYRNPNTRYIILLVARLLAAVIFSKELERTIYFQSVQTDWHFTDSGPAKPKRKMQRAVVVLPARSL